MQKKACLILLVACLFCVLSCKKESQQQNISQQTQVSSLGSGVVSFSISGQLLNTSIDTQKNVITIIIPHTFNLHSLTINFTLAQNVNATIKNTGVTSGSVMDFSKIVYFTVTTTDKKRSSTFLIDVQTDLYYYGLTGILVSEKSLNKNYNFYFDQFDGSTWELVNCGPTVSTMAIKWADSTFSKKPVDARNTYEPTGGWWSTRNVTDYLTDDGINYVTDTLSNIDSLVKTNIDANKVIILCLDMFYVGYNSIQNQHLNKFYSTDAAGWGHFILVKGYKQMEGAFYLEVYDPYSQGRQYYPSVIPNELMGIDRYYSDSDINAATATWNPYAYIVSPKGPNTGSSSKLSVYSTHIHKPVPIAFGR